MEGDADFEEVKNGLGSLVVLDVRNRDEVEKEGQIPGSHCVPFNELEEALQLDTDSFKARYGFELKGRIVTHCMKGGRARKAGTMLQGKGYDARVYAGSFTDWKEKGGKIEPGKPHVPDS